LHAPLHVASPRRFLMSLHIARLASSVAPPQIAISPMVREHPSQSPVCGFIVHTLTHGDGTSPELRSGSNSFISFCIADLFHQLAARNATSATGAPVIASSCCGVKLNTACGWPAAAQMLLSFSRSSSTSINVLPIWPIGHTPPIA
jgi:hypothetical protein